MADKKETPRDVEEIVKDYLKTNGFDGLCREECGCGLDDLIPCLGGIFCVPAYRWECSKCKVGCKPKFSLRNSWWEDDDGCYQETKQEG